jgi:hypothetical protein
MQKKLLARNNVNYSDEPLWYKIMWFFPPFVIIYFIIRYEFKWTPTFLNQISEWDETDEGNDRAPFSMRFDP